MITVKSPDQDQCIDHLAQVSICRREKKEEKTPISSSKVLFRFSSPTGSFTE